jgi:hypothetical protein
VGLAVGLVQVLHDNPVDGDQLYVEAPETLRADEPPAQIVGAEDVVMAGGTLTVTVTVAVLLQPLALMPVTV